MKGFEIQFWHMNLVSGGLEVCPIKVGVVQSSFYLGLIQHYLSSLEGFAFSERVPPNCFPSSAKERGTSCCLRTVVLDSFSKL